MAEIVLTSRHDWKLYCQQRVEGSHQILALTPNAQSEVLDHIFPLIDTMIARKLGQLQRLCLQER